MENIKKIIECSGNIANSLVGALKDGFDWSDLSVLMAHIGDFQAIGNAVPEVKNEYSKLGVNEETKELVVALCDVAIKIRNQF